MAQQLHRGSLIVRPISGKLIRDVATTSMDPYVVIRVGAHEQKTNYCKDGGKTPNWEEQLNFIIAGEDQIYIQVWDKRTVAKDKIIGEAVIPIFNIVNSKHFEDWVDLLHKGQNVGQLRLHLVFNEEFQSGAQQGQGLPAQGQQLPQSGF